jgi:thiol-disulfide isomerase/thioredoxin
MKSLVFPVGLLVAIVGLFGVIGLTSDNNWSATTSGKKTNSTPNDILKPFVVSQTLPNLIVKKEDGGSYNLTKDLPEKALVTFWTSTCAECKTGLPILADFAKQNPNFPIIYINVRDEIKTAKDELNQLNLSINTLFDLDGKAFANLATAMPTSLFIEKGQITVRFPGRISQDHLKALLTLN